MPPESCEKTRPQGRGRDELGLAVATRISAWASEGVKGLAVHERMGAPPESGGPASCAAPWNRV